MKRWLGLGLSGTLLCLSAHARACACGVPGLDSALTSQTERWGLRLAQDVGLGAGRFNARGDYHRFAAHDQERRYELSALTAYRPQQRLELSLAYSYLRDSTAGAGTQSSLSGSGDTVGRARFEPIDETPPYTDGPPLPSLALIGSLRAPTGMASSLASLGLGAWEGAAGVSLERGVTSKLRVGLMGEAGVRLGDTTFGVSRRLGPRSSTQLTGWYWPAPQLVMSLSSSVLWEGDARIDGELQPGSGSRQVVVGAGVAYRPPASNLRTAFAARYVLPVSGFGVNALVATTLELSLAYTR